MDHEAIIRVANETLSGNMLFPESFGWLMAANVEYYTVDLVALKKIFYDGNEGMLDTSLVIEALPPIASDFRISEIKKNFTDKLMNGLEFKEFCRRSRLAGVHSYSVHLRSRKVIFNGRAGASHTAKFL